MNYKVSITGGDKFDDTTLEIAMGETILAAALMAGIDFPHGCRSGNCGACKAVLHSGEIEMSPYSEYALTPEEKARGLILPCRAVPWSDCAISKIDADEAVVHASRQLNCEVLEIIQATHDIRIVRLKIISGGPYDFSAGQYASVSFVGQPPRDYSMANLPGANILEFHIRLVAGGQVTPYVQDHLKPGDQVRVQGPYGTAYFRENHPGPILAVAGGSGLAPIKAILAAAVAKEAAPAISFYFGVRAERDLYLADFFANLAATHQNFSFIPVLSEPRGDTTRRTGLLAEVIAEDFSDLDGTKAYLAGPPIMVESTVEKLTLRGIKRADCHADAFYTTADKMKLEDK